jgi:two-component system CheB/CheR fusion protein
MFLEGEAIEQLPLEGGLQAGRATTDTVQRLVQELQATQSRLRTTREESEAANEELRAANEELQSINEEYRSTSEELETSKEELQSINEELQTVNNELKLKLEAVSRANSDLQNLMAATDFGTLFLDPNLRIKRFTKHVTDLFNITPSDEGRPITDFSNQLEYDGLVDDARAVLAHLAPIRREVRSRSKCWYDLRLRPYRTIDDKIDGVVISFIDVTDRRRTEDALRESEERLRQQMRLVESSSERQDMILHEYSHRVKNTLAVVQAMAHQTMRTSQSNDEFIERFDARLAALADAHNLLLESNWRGAELGELARKQLQPYLTTKAKRIRIEGEPVVLPADLATPLGLVLHELATNAAKHGALTRTRGSVSLTWSLSDAEDPPVVVILWEESGGPPPKRSKESGFGSALIKGAIPAAQIKHEFRRDGVFCRIALPLRAEPAIRDND